MNNASRENQAIADNEFHLVKAVIDAGCFAPSVFPGGKTVTKSKIIYVVSYSCPLKHIMYVVFYSCPLRQLRISLWTKSSFKNVNVVRIYSMIHVLPSVLHCTKISQYGLYEQVYLEWWKGWRVAVLGNIKLQVDSTQGQSNDGISIWFAV